MSKKETTTWEHCQMDETVFRKLGDKFKGYKHIIEEGKPNTRNVEAVDKFALWLVDNWTLWEETATKLAEETKDPEI